MSSLALLEQMLTKGKVFWWALLLWAAVFLLPPYIGNTSLVTTPARSASKHVSGRSRWAYSVQ